MGDDDELRLFGEFFQKLGKFVDVRFVERRLDFVEHAEGHGTEHQDGEQDGDRRQRAFAARKKGNLGQFFPRRAGDDLDARGEGIVRFGIVHLQFRFAAAEQFSEQFFEILVDLVKARVELLLHLPFQFFESGARVVDALLHVVALGAHLLVLRGERLVFFEGVVIDRAEGVDLALQAVDERLPLFGVKVFVFILQARFVCFLIFLIDARL